MGTMKSRKLRELTQKEIELIGRTVSEFEKGTLAEVKGFCAVVSTEDIAKQDFILTPGRYVGLAEVEDDGEAFEDKMERLTGELRELFAESKKAEEEIKEQLKSVGFEV
jgi:type I restriction enzyme M protein